MPGETKTSRTLASIGEFQSAPGLDAGRNAMFPLVGLPVVVFQSAPGIDAGRNSRDLEFPRSYTRFNPLPASMPGETAATAPPTRRVPFQSAPGIDAGREPVVAV